MIKVSDFVANFLAENGVRHVYMLTGGGAMHLNNSLGKHPKLQVVYNHHEQASAMAAESHARLTNELPVLNVTTGPGGLNTLNGVFGAWTDSIPMFVISGQVRFDTTIESSGTNIRQLGDQEVDIIGCVKPITKYAESVKEANMIKYHLQKALHIAKNGRPGPVWIDIPMNIQGASVDEAKLLEFDPNNCYPKVPAIVPKRVTEVLERIAKAKRPVIMVGSGVRLSGAHADFMKMIEKLKIPVATTFTAHDALYEEHPLYVGRPSTIGDRAGNFAVQNADLVLILGSRLPIRQISYNYQSFAREAYKIMVDIDALELIKPTLNIDMPIHGDVKDFMQQMLAELSHTQMPSKHEWLEWCLERRRRYPVVLKEYWDLEKTVNPYCFMHTLGEHMPENQIIVTGDGTACVVAFQAIQLKKGQRLYSNYGCASMGYDLPAAIGACVASGNKSVVCLAGDGSMQQNIQELATIVFNKYPIKIFVMNNNGYHSIRQTQTNFFGTPYVGVGPESGLGFPDLKKLSAAYGLPYFHCDKHADLDSAIAATLNQEGPAICEVMLTLEQQFAPKLSSRRLADGRMVTKPLEDLAPFLSREEFAENMLIPMMPEPE